METDKEKEGKLAIVVLYTGFKRLELKLGTIVFVVMFIASWVLFGMTIKSGLFYYLPITLFYFKFRHDVSKKWNDKIKSWTPKDGDYI